MSQDKMLLDMLAKSDMLLADSFRIAVHWHFTGIKTEVDEFTVKSPTEVPVT